MFQNIAQPAWSNRPSIEVLVNADNEESIII